MLPIFWDIQISGDQNFDMLFIKLYFHFVGDMKWFISRQLTANLLCVKNHTLAIFHLVL